ncbi:hypothetical protein [Streptomyces albicerus]|uniref:hypothetical protein n=1 Tax=Streptomyces albicerus TaxID=2569859 RepID=UPI00124BC565|nr:hypothetical protein [Streptomyces albicerus]
MQGISVTSGDPTTQDPVTDAAGAIQRAIAETLNTAGPTTITLVFATLLITAMALIRLRRARDACRSPGTDTCVRPTVGRTP